MLEIALELLEGLGYRVIAVKSPNDAISIAKEHGQEINLLLTDVVMPEMNGKELVDAVRTHVEGIRTLFMSGYTANVVAHHGILEEGIYFLQKPFSRQQLALKVREVLDSP